MTRLHWFRAVLVVLTGMICPNTWGCIGPTRPLEDEAYPKIFLGEVVGIRLVDYAAARLEQMRKGTATAWMTDESPAYEVDLLLIETFRGALASQVTLKVPRGCAIPEADLRLFGIFYANEDGTALPIYQDDLEYAERLGKLGSRYTAACATSEERGAPHPCWKPRASALQCLTRLRSSAGYFKSSCPGAVDDLYEYMNSRTMGRYNWKMPAVDRSLQP